MKTQSLRDTYIKSGLYKKFIFGYAANIFNALAKSYASDLIDKNKLGFNKTTATTIGFNLLFRNVIKFSECQTDLNISSSYNEWLNNNKNHQKIYLLDKNNKDFSYKKHADSFKSVHYNTVTAGANLLGKLTAAIAWTKFIKKSDKPIHKIISEKTFQQALVSSIKFGISNVSNLLDNISSKLKKSEKKYFDFLEVVSNSSESLLIISNKNLIDKKLQDLKKEYEKNKGLKKIGIETLNFFKDSLKATSKLIKPILKYSQIKKEDEYNFYSKILFDLSINQVSSPLGELFGNTIDKKNDLVESLLYLHKTNKIISNVSEQKSNHSFTEDDDTVKIKEIVVGDRVKLEKGDSINLKRGEILEIKGINGSGKSTIAFAVKDLLKVDEGEILLPKKWKKTPEKIALINQDACNIPYITVDEILGGSKVVQSEKFISLWHHIDIGKYFTNFKNKGISQLSSGERSVILTLNAIMKDAEMLILDESLSCLAPETSKKLIEIIEAYAKCDKNFAYGVFSQNDSKRFVITVQHDLHDLGKTNEIKLQKPKFK